MSPQVRTPLIEKRKNPGSDLLSRPVARTVPSALEGLTAVFGMGTGVSPPPLPPGNLLYDMNANWLR